MLRGAGAGVTGRLHWGDGRRGPGALPAGKAHALGFLQASTRVDAEGTWRDPEQVSDDESAPNVVLEVEFGETEREVVSRAVLVALRVVNDLEVNEQVLYARIDDIEESSLAPSPVI